MTTLYWYKTGVDDNWTTLTGNWWLDAEHTQQAPAYPVNGDSVYLLGSTAPIGTPTVTLALFDTQGLSGQMTTPFTPGITISAGGVLRIGCSTYNHMWGGNASSATTIEFYSRGFIVIGGTVGDNAVFNDYSFVIGGTVGDNAVFNDYSCVIGGTVGDNAVFNDYAYVDGNGTVGDNAVFNDYSFVSGGTVGTVIWNSEGHAHLSQCTLNGDWALLKPLNISSSHSGTGKILVPRREMDTLIGTGGAKIVVGQAYGYGEC